MSLFGTDSSASIVLMGTYVFTQTDSSALGAASAHFYAELLMAYDWPAYWGLDTLIDMNGDGHDDLLIEFYSPTGTGLKNGAHIYLFDATRGMFVGDPVDLPNLTFNFKDHTLSSYYVGAGGGYATRFRWKGLDLDTLESIDMEHVELNGSDVWIVVTRDHLTGYSRSTVSHAVWLPANYHYMDYVPVIKRAAD
jgi:hypothetical protein